MTVTASVNDILRTLADQPGDVVFAPAPGAGPGHWLGAPSAVFDGNWWWLAYRVRRPLDEGRGIANIVARSRDASSWETVATVTSDGFGAASLERPALVRRPDGAWRLYVSCATVGSKHWWVEALDAADPSGLADGERAMVLPGDAAEAWKDPVVWHDGQQWQMWACRHPLDGGDDAADRMSSHRAVSSDGLVWHWSGQVLTPTAGTWDQRGTRVSTAYRGGVFYDGRASAAENWYERTGFATASPLVPTDGPVGRAGAALRYLSVVEGPEGVRLFWEATRSDGAHDLRTALVTAH